MLIFLQLFLRQSEYRFIHQSRNRNLDPVLTRPLVVGAIAAAHPIPLSQGTSDPLSRPQFRLTKTSFALISRIPQNAPHRRAFPASFRTTSRNLPFIQQSCNCVNARELHQKLILWRFSRRRFQEDHRYSTARELFNQQYLIRILAAKPVWGIYERCFDLALRCEIPHGLQSRSDQAGATVAFVLKHPFRRHQVVVSDRVLLQRCRLTRYGLVLLLPIRRHSSVNRGGFVHSIPSPELLSTPSF